MSKGASQSMRDCAVETQHLNYKPIFKMPAHYIKFKEPVYEGYENFSFNELNYEIAEKDLKFLSSGLIDITPADFEKVIDVFEKIVVLDSNQSLMHLTSRFYDKAPVEFRHKIKKEQLEIIYQKVSLLFKYSFYHTYIHIHSPFIVIFLLSLFSL